MQETSQMVEYGVPIDARTMIEPPDAAELELQLHHPTLPPYVSVQRRKDFFAVCRRHRVGRLGTPLIDYKAEETRIWREVSPKLDELHQKHASQIYLNAKKELGISQSEIPQLKLLSGRLEQETNMH